MTVFYNFSYFFHIWYNRTQPYFTSASSFKRLQYGNFMKKIWKQADRSWKKEKHLITFTQNFAYSLCYTRP